MNELLTQFVLTEIILLFTHICVPYREMRIGQILLRSSYTTVELPSVSILAQSTPFTLTKPTMTPVSTLSETLNESRSCTSWPICGIQVSSGWAGIDSD